MRREYCVNLVNLGGLIPLGGPLITDCTWMQMRQVVRLSVVLKGPPLHLINFLCFYEQTISFRLHHPLECSGVMFRQRLLFHLVVADHMGGFALGQ